MSEEYLSFKEMAELEPGLLDLEEWVKGVKGNDPDFCTNRVWYQKIRPRLYALVGNYHGIIPEVNYGREAKVERIKTVACYHTAQYYLLGLLPPCRNCSCLGPKEYPCRDRESRGDDWEAEAKTEKRDRGWQFTNEC